MKAEPKSRLNIFNYLLLLVIPLSYNFWGTDPALYHKFFLTDVTLLAVLVLLFNRKEQLPKFSREALIFSGLYAISILLALPGMLANQVNNADGWFIWLQLAVFPVFVLLLLLVGNTGTSGRLNISKIVSWLALISVIISAVQYISEISGKGWSLSACDAVRGTYAHKNIFAEVMFLTLPFSCYVFIITGKKRYAAVTAATVLMIGLSLSRAVLAGMATATVLTALVYFIANFKPHIRWYYIPLAFISTVAIVVLYHWLATHTGMGRRLVFFYNLRNTIHERRELWQATVRLIRAYPFFGVGLGGWKIMSLQYSMLGLRNYQTFFQQPHNDFLWIISEQGFISFIFLALAWLYLSGILVRNISRSPADVFNYFMLFGLTGYFVYSNFGFPRERAEHGILLAFMAPFILSEEEPKFKLTLPRLGAFVMGVLLLIAAWWAGNKVMSQVHMRHALEYREVHDLEKESEYLDKINPTYYTLDGTATPVAWYRGMIYYEYNNNDAALAEFEEAVKRNPYHAYSLANLGTCLSAAGDNKKAEQYFRQALDYSEGFPDAALNMCALKFNKGEVDSAAWYLCMARDSLSDPRYVKFLKVLTSELVKSVADSAAVYSETSLAENYKSLLSRPAWQMDIFRKAYMYKRPVEQQMWMDILWVLKYQEKNKEIADKYQKSLHLPAI